jgi:hypothetical protein
MLPVAAIPGTVGLGVFVEVEVDPQDSVAQQLEVGSMYVRSTARWGSSMR